MLENSLIPHRPTPKQAAFLLLPHTEVFYGGAVGGGKSDALLMAALQYLHVPRYAALILRRNYGDLNLPEALIPRAHDWLRNTEAVWSEGRKSWYVPGGGSLTFGYLEHENQKYRYQSSAYQFVGFDEVTQFTESQYLYLFSRLRRLKEIGDIPIRMRSAGNPDGVGYEWVKKRFEPHKGGRPDRPFIAAGIDDNPYLDGEEYKRTLDRLDPLTRDRLKHGDWTVKPEGRMFKAHWFDIIEEDELPAQMDFWVRYWDLAATEEEKGKNPDYTAGALVGKHRGIYYIKDMKRERLSPYNNEKLIKQVAQRDGREVFIGMEQEPGAAGKMLVERYQREVLSGYAFWGNPSTGNKATRAAPVSSAAEVGNVKIVNGPWVEDFLDELLIFPVDGMHDDQVDAVSGAWTLINFVEEVIESEGDGAVVEGETITISPY